MKKITVSLLVFTLLQTLIPVSFANQLPQALATDARIKIVSYRPHDVITIYGSPFVVTSIEFAHDEQILSVVNGDSVAWLTEVNKAAPYLLSLKPVLPTSRTNMTVITDKRLYTFHLNTSAKNPTYLLRFRYSNEQPLFNKTSLALTNWNDHYSFAGDVAIAPQFVKDNGMFTIFHFAKQQSIPAIFIVNPHRQERIANVRMQHDEVIVQGVHAHYTLRSGQTVGSIFNDARLQAQRRVS